MAYGVRVIESEGSASSDTYDNPKTVIGVFFEAVRNGNEAVIYDDDGNDLDDDALVKYLTEHGPKSDQQFLTFLIDKDDVLSVGDMLIRLSIGAMKYEGKRYPRMEIYSHTLAAVEGTYVLSIVCREL